MISKLNFRVLCVSFLSITALFGANNTYANNDDVWQKLAEGGKVVLMRHAAVVAGQENGSLMLRDPSCKEERNLSAEGRNVARTIGKMFQDRKIQIAEIRHSPFCRTTDTANIAFGGGTPVEYLYVLELRGPEEAAVQTKKLNQIIGSYAGKGNLVLITHEPNISAVSFELLKQSDFLVLQPAGGDKFEEIGVMRWEASI